MKVHLRSFVLRLSPFSLRLSAFAFPAFSFQRGLTSPVNLLALGRCQPLYVAFRLCRDLCFW